MAIESLAIHVPSGAEVQRQIDEAAPNATVTLPAGRITGCFVIDKPLVLRGAGADQTVLEGDGSGPVLAIEAEDGTVRVDDLAITGGRSSFGGGLSCSNGARVEVHRCLVNNNRAPQGQGGGIAIDEGELLVSECTLVWNAASVGGAVFAGGQARVQIAASILGDNLAVTGGALAVHDGVDFELWTCRMDDNRADEAGHHLWGLASTLRRPHAMLRNSVLGPSSDPMGCAIKNHGTFKAQIGLDNTAVARAVNAAMLLA